MASLGSQVPSLTSRPEFPSGLRVTLCPPAFQLSGSRQAEYDVSAVWYKQVLVASPKENCGQLVDDLKGLNYNGTQGLQLHYLANWVNRICPSRLVRGCADCFWGFCKHVVLMRQENVPMSVAKRTSSCLSIQLCSLEVR
jgi:hypothetical protein